MGMAHGLAPIAFIANQESRSCISKSTQTAAPSSSVHKKAATVVACALAGMLSVAAAAQEWERAPMCQASSVLPPELRGGTGLSVDEPATNDGFVNQYTVRAGERHSRY
jgi:hypothetical protein